MHKISETFGRDYIRNEIIGYGIPIYWVPIPIPKGYPHLSLPGSTRKNFSELSMWIKPSPNEYKQTLYIQKKADA